MKKEIISFVFLIFWCQIGCTYRQKRFPMESQTKNGTTLEANGTTLEATDGEAKTTATETVDTSMGTTADSEELNPTESIGISTLLTTSSISSASNDTTEPNLNQDLTTISSLTKGLMITVCVSYFSLFILCVIRSWIKNFKTKPFYTVLYSRLNNNRDDSILLMENME